MTTERDPLHALAVFLAADPDATGRLLALHVADVAGHCRACTLDGRAGHWTWPCRISLGAQAARRLLAGDAPGR